MLRQIDEGLDKESEAGMEEAAGGRAGMID